MRKNYFAKKFVAYSMAFAVAFSTLTVSPVFVKEAKAAFGVGSVEAGTIVIADGQFLISKNCVSSKSDSTTELAKQKVVDKINGADNTNSKVINFTASSGSMAVGNPKTTYKYEDVTFATSAIDAAQVATTPVEVKFATDGTFVTSDYDGVTAWYQLSPFSVDVTIDSGVSTTPIETITAKVLEVTQLKKNNSAVTGNLSFTKDTMTNNQYGLYLGKTSGGFVLVNLIATTSLKATSEKDTFTVQPGGDANLVVHASNDGSREITYKWRYGQTVLPSTTNECKIEKVDGTKTGKYTCTVSDGAGQVDLNMQLETATAISKNLVYTNVVEALNGAPANSGDPAANTLIAGNVALTSSIPTNDNYRYVWVDVAAKGASPATANELKLSEKSLLNYDAANNSLVVTEPNKTATYDGKDITCYTLTKEAYEDIAVSDSNYPDAEKISDLLKKLDEAQSEVAKNNIKIAIRKAERKAVVTKTDGSMQLGFKALFTEKFELVTSDDYKTTKSVNIVKNIGDSVEMTAQSAKTSVVANEMTFKADGTMDKAGKTAGQIEYKVNGNTATSTTKITNVSANDFGSYKYDTVETYKETTMAEAAAADTAANVAGFDKFVKINADFTNTDITTSVAGASASDPYVAGSVGAYETANPSVNVYKVTTLPKEIAKATTYYNIIFKTDLKAEAVASTVKAKIGAKNVELAVNASSSAGVKYTWYKTTGGVKSVVKALSTAAKYTIDTVAPDDIYEPEIKNELGKVTDVDDNYYTCVVTNGVEEITVKFTLTQDGGYKVYANKKDAGTGTSVVAPLNINGNTNASKPVSAILGKELTLAPYVVAGEGVNITYKWYDVTDSRTILSETNTLTVTLKELSNYVCVISDGTDEFKLTYTVSEAAIDKNDVTLKVAAIEDQIFTGKEITPELDVRISGAEGSKLVQGTDYTVEFVENVNVGVARVKVTPAGLYKGETQPKEFYINRADNTLEIADKTVVLGGSVQPKTVKNTAKATLSYAYFTDAECANEIEVPSKVGTYYVKATSAATLNYKEATSNVATVKVVPGKVKMLGTSRTASSVKLNWNKTTGATSYRVFYKAAGAKSYKVFKNTTATSMNVTGLASATTYTFAVKAYAKTAGYSTVYATKQTTTAPAKVGTLKVTVGSKKATVKFDKVARATGYQIYMAKGNGSYKKVATTKSLSFTKTGLAKGATYKFKVRAYKTVGSNTYYGAFSSAKAVKVK